MPDRRLKAGATTTIVAATLLSACGSSSSATPRAASSGEGAKPVAQIYADAQAALASVHSYHLSLDSVSKSQGHLHMELSVAGPGQLQGVVTLRGAPADAIYVGGAAYVRGHDFFAAVAGPRAAVVIGDSWVKLPAANPLSAGFAQLTDLHTAAQCLMTVHGTLAKGQATHFQGHPVIEIKDLADVPGDSPGTLDISTVGPAYPLHAIQTGPATAGTATPVPGCTVAGQAPATPGDTVSSELSYSAFNAPVTVTPPPHPLDLTPGSPQA